MVMVLSHHIQPIARVPLHTLSKSVRLRLQPMESRLKSQAMPAAADSNATHAGGSLAFVGDEALVVSNQAHQQCVLSDSAQN